MDGRDVAQFGSALDWGSRGRRFKSGRPDGFFERLYPKLGTKSAMIVPTCLRRHEQSIHGGDYTVLIDRVAATAEIPRPGRPLRRFAHTADAGGS